MSVSKVSRILGFIFLSKSFPKLLKNEFKTQKRNLYRYFLQMVLCTYKKCDGENSAEHLQHNNVFPAGRCCSRPSPLWEWMSSLQLQHQRTAQDSSIIHHTVAVTTRTRTHWHGPLRDRWVSGEPIVKRAAVMSEVRNGWCLLEQI